MYRLALYFLFLSPTLCQARDKAENWLEVSSPHFSVVTNTNEKQARRVADQFERMRAAFHVSLPRASVDPGVPIIVLAVKDEKDIRALEPEAYLGRGKLQVGGLFLRAPDKNYVLMRLDATGEHPYAVIYHEYTHLLNRKAADWLPLWLNEGLAEFYQTTEIRDKEVAVGEPITENRFILMQNHLLPLATLLAVDRTSPYYQEENKGSIFYAESWAVTHYLFMKDIRENTHHLSDYEKLVSEKVDAVTAATQAFGDLKLLQVALEKYIEDNRYFYSKTAGSIEVDDTAFKVQALSGVQADAVRADFLAYNQRVKDARTLLDQVLREEPNNVSAHETMGYLEFRQGHLDEAMKWYEQAVKLDSQSFVAHYYFAAIAMNRGQLNEANAVQVESSLRTAIKLNPAFAPSYDRLAEFYGMRRQNLDEAHTLALNAIQLDPANVGYRLTAANILLVMQRSKDAMAVLQSALKVAQSPAEVAAVSNALQAVGRREGNYDIAIEALNRAVEADPKSKTAWNQLGLAYLDSRQDNLAISSFRKQIEVNPQDEYAYNNLGRVYLRQRKYEEAIKWFRKQIEINPLDRWAHSNLGIAYLEQYKYADAVPELEQAVSLTPDNAESLVRLGAAYLNLGQDEKATATFDKALTISAKPLIWNNIAYQLALKKTHLDVARRYAVSAVTSTEAALRNMSFDELNVGEVGLTASLANYWDTLGWVEFADDNRDKAEKYILAAWQLGQHSAVADHLAQLCEKRGEKDRALHFYALAMSARRPEPETRDRLAALAGGNDKVDAMVEKSREELTAQRTVKLSNTSKLEGKAEFFLLLTSDQGSEPTVDNVKFAGGDERLKVFTDALRAARYSQMVPDQSTVKLLRRGTLSCAAVAADCTLLLALPEDVKSVD